MCLFHRSIKSAALAAVLLSAVLSEAEAAIRCDGRFQIIKGQSLATPYCEDNYLAEISRAYGLRVTGAAVRNNPGIKAEVCRFVGHDSRVRDICAGYIQQNRDRRLF